jgi:hypothetical protein
MELELDRSIKGGAEVGDVIWLSRRKKIPEVGLAFDFPDVADE